MKLVVSGSRHITDYNLFYQALGESGFLTTKKGVECLIQGGAAGVDGLAKRWAEANSVPVMTIEADWDAHGRSAGPIRNSEMIQYAIEDGEPAGLLAIWDGYSKGTWDCIKKAQAKGLIIYIKMLNVLDAAKLQAEKEAKRKRWKDKK
jgi:hypothetical protein